MATGATNALVFIIDALARLYLLVLLLRLFLPLMRADFQNPLAQAILKLTSPLVVPVRRILPPLGRIDTATVVIAFGIQYLALADHHPDYRQLGQYRRLQPGGCDRLHAHGAAVAAVPSPDRTAGWLRHFADFRTDRTRRPDATGDGPGIG